ncbi:uncharacterized protein si:ch211-241b2.5 [Notolabrus celidotus]|uniref:uncharacterized protein si:ch211-241b2.5 n=1 Tax=Notolabrus celidotus TaxID=1203425 RepID=UPI00148F90FF|nr:uncharacterized protein si:ch211-241b2.5 [Notolabrus celidotus]
MDLALVLVLQVLFQPALSAVLFTVEAEQSLYESEFGGNVELGCSFQPKLSSPHADLKVTWNRIPSASAGHIYWMDNGKELTDSQDPDYRGRVKLLKEELNNGLAKLQISRLRINDSGRYQCLVETSEGADYKAITLSVKAPYRDVTKHIGKSKEDEVLLSCQSKGYPESSVVWQDGNMQRLNANTSAVSTTEQLFIVTSQIRVKSPDKNNYTCSFTRDGYSATFKIPDDFSASHERSDAVIITLCLAVMVFIIIIAVLMYRRKGCRNAVTRNLCVNGGGRNVLPAFCLQIQRENEEEKITFNEGCMEENLGAFLKAHYLNLPFTQMPRQYWEAFGVEVLPHRLQNNEGQPVNLQALLPEVGETLLLEGAPGSGKTTLAQILVSSWTEGPDHAFPNLLDLSAVQLLLYMDCSRAKSDLFQEMMTQLHTEKISKEEELRTVLTRSKEALLLLDGYKEGEQIFDESLRRFLNEPEGCRVLVMACTGHCEKLKEIIGTGLVELQTDTDTLS